MKTMGSPSARLITSSKHRSRNDWIHWKINYFLLSKNVQNAPINENESWCIGWKISQAMSFNVELPWCLFCETNPNENLHLDDKRFGSVDDAIIPRPISTCDSSLTQSGKPSTEAHTKGSVRCLNFAIDNFLFFSADANCANRSLLYSQREANNSSPVCIEARKTLPIDKYE